MKTIDTRGLSCPQPVIMVTKALKEDNESFEVLIDDETACENVLRTLQQFRLNADIKEENEYKIYKVQR